MYIRLELYRIFKEVAITLNFSKAAQNLFITQSAVSQAMKQLENQLLVSLFIRKKQGVALTYEGEVLFGYINSAMSLIHSAENKMQKINELLYGDLIISAGDSISENVLIPYLQKFNGLYPKIKLRVINRTSLQAVSLLKSGGCDIAFANLPINDNAIDVVNFMEVEDVFVAGNNYEFLKEKTVSRQELIDYPLIMLEKTSNSRNYVENEFFKDGIKLSPEIELGAHNLLLKFAEINLGISCVVKQFSMGALNQQRVFELKQKDPLPKRSIGICTLSGVELSKSATRFIEIINQK